MENRARDAILLIVRRVLVLLLPLALLALSVPWPFVADSGRRLLGLPVWAVYSLAMAALFAITVAVMIGRCWELSAGGDDDDGDPS